MNKYMVSMTVNAAVEAPDEETALEYAYRAFLNADAPDQYEVAAFHAEEDESLKPF